MAAVQGPSADACTTKRRQRCWTCRERALEVWLFCRSLGSGKRMGVTRGLVAIACVKHRAQCGPDQQPQEHEEHQHMYACDVQMHLK